MSFAHSSYPSLLLDVLFPPFAVAQGVDGDGPASNEEHENISFFWHRGLTNPSPEPFEPFGNFASTASFGPSGETGITYPVAPGSDSYSSTPAGPTSNTSVNYNAQLSFPQDDILDFAGVDLWNAQDAMQLAPATPFGSFSPCGLNTPALTFSPCDLNTPALTFSPCSSCADSTSPDVFPQPPVYGGGMAAPAIENQRFPSLASSPIGFQPNLPASPWALSDAAALAATFPHSQPSHNLPGTGHFVSYPPIQPFSELRPDDPFPSLLLPDPGHHVHARDAASNSPQGSSADSTASLAHAASPSSARVRAFSRPAKTKRRARARTAPGASPTKRHAPPAPARAREQRPLVCAYGCPVTFGAERSRARHERLHLGGPVCEYFCARAGCAGNRPLRRGDRPGYARADSLLRHLDALPEDNACVHACRAVGWRKEVKGSVAHLKVNPLDPSTYAHLLPD